MFLSLALIIATSLVYISLIRTFEKRAGLLKLSGALLWGGVSFYIALTVQNHFLHGLLIDQTGIHLFSAPVLEELLKALPLLVFLRLTDRRTAVVYGFALGIGFALAESAYFLQHNPENVLGMALARVISIHLIHAVSTALVGLLVNRWGRALLLAMLVHAAYNLLVLSLDGQMLVIGAGYAGVGSMIALMLLTPLAQQRRVSL